MKISKMVSIVSCEQCPFVIGAQQCWFCTHPKTNLNTITSYPDIPDWCELADYEKQDEK